jgi:hypothetical protein
MKRNKGEENTVFENSFFGDVCEERLAATYVGTKLSKENKSRFYEREIRPGTLLIPECGPLGYKSEPAGTWEDEAPTSPANTDAETNKSQLKDGASCNHDDGQTNTLSGPLETEFNQ